MRILYVKESCKICPEAIEYVDYKNIIFIEEDKERPFYYTYNAKKNKTKGRQTNIRVPFESIPAIPALFDSNLMVTIIGGSAVVPIVAGSKTMEEVINGAVVFCCKCKKKMFYNKSGLCGECRERNDKTREAAGE